MKLNKQYGCIQLKERMADSHETFTLFRELRFFYSEEVWVVLEDKYGSGGKTRYKLTREEAMVCDTQGRWNDFIVTFEPV